MIGYFGNDITCYGLLKVLCLFTFNLYNDFGGIFHFTEEKTESRNDQTTYQRNSSCM